MEGEEEEQDTLILDSGEEEEEGLAVRGKERRKEETDNGECERNGVAIFTAMIFPLLCVSLFGFRVKTQKLPGPRKDAGK